MDVTVSAIQGVNSNFIYSPFVYFLQNIRMDYEKAVEILAKHQTNYPEIELKEILTDINIMAEIILEILSLSHSS